jgi:DNA polymerase-3 subunit alpha
MLSFVPLHLHTEWSLLDGSIRIKDLVPRLLEYGYLGCAITDHGTLFGLVHFYKALKEANLKPLLGCEFYLAPGSRFEKNKKNADYFHLILIAKNEAGYKNLIKLGSKAYLEGFYYKPRIDKDLLKEYSEGLIALSACLEGEIPKLLLLGEKDKAKEAALFYKQLFGEDLYLEVQFNDLPEQKKVNELMLELGEELGIKVVGTTDSHYLDRDSFKAHEVLLCIQTNSRLDDPKRFRFNTDKLFLPSPADLEELASSYPKEVLDNTFEVYEKVNLELKLGEPIFPRAKLPDAETAESYLVKKARQGLERRLAELESQGKLAASKEGYWKRLEMELEVIIEKGYASYFLIVSDFIEWARAKGIPVGPGRGSAAGALTSYALYITNLDPIRWGLLFERFLNKERPSLPDIDVDFCMERRDEVIEYVAKTYGQEYIAKIATFGSLSARQAIRDVGRVLGFKPKEIDPIAKMITPGPQTTLQEEVKRPEIQRLMESSPRIRELFEIALKLEGLPRHPSIHAAGVVISGVPVVEVAPLMKMDEDEVVVQYDMKASEAVGLIKFDFLGLKTLTIINNTLKLIKEEEGEEIDLNSIPLDDPKVFELLSSGETDGVFQLESEGMKDLLRRLKPTDFNDLIAVLALYRPGPLGGGLVDRYIETKHGRRAPEYPHPLLEPILKETYGVIVYQEQVMEIARALAGYTLGEADLLRRAIGKKEKELMQNLKSDFIERAKSRGIAEEIAEKVFDLIEKFADYGFNKSHAGAYALLSYQTAYLKAHYPLYFLASILTYEVGKSEEVSKYLSVAERMKIKVLPPDVNKSGAGFIVEGQALRLGLQAIKNVGEEAVKEIISKRPYRSFIEFCQKVDSQKVNQRVVSALIKAGAFDSLEPNRAKLLANLPKILSFSQQMKMSTLFGQASLLSVSSNPVLEDVPPWTEDELLQFEKEALGFYLTSHPLKKWRPFVELFSKTNLSQVIPSPSSVIPSPSSVIPSPSSVIPSEARDPSQGFIIIACLISDLTYKKTRTSEQMAILRLEDEFSNAKALLFPDVLNRALEFLQEGRLIWVRAKVDKDEESLSLIVEDIAPIEDLRMFTEGRFELEIEAKEVEPSMLMELKEFLSERGDPCLPIKLILKYPDWYVHFEPNGLSLPLDKTKITMMKELFPAIVLKYQP